MAAAVARPVSPPSGGVIALVPVTRVLTIPEAAEMIGWVEPTPRSGAKRLFRHLKRVNEQLGRTLLRNIGTEVRPRWTLTVGALKAIAPEWFRDPEEVDRQLAELRDKKEELESRIKRLERISDSTVRRIAAMNSERKSA